ncbi:hypothetical protein Vretimale_9144, partial [Volvox reticuliferus]
RTKFAVIFILLAIILRLAAIIWGRHFAEQLVKPIRELVIAAKKVKNGDLTEEQQGRFRFTIEFKDKQRCVFCLTWSRDGYNGVQRAFGSQRLTCACRPN